jgi:hypothetical protein
MFRYSKNVLLMQTLKLQLQYNLHLESQNDKIRGVNSVIYLFT